MFWPNVGIQVGVFLCWVKSMLFIVFCGRFGVFVIGLALGQDELQYLHNLAKKDDWERHMH